MSDNQHKHDLMEFNIEIMQKEIDSLRHMHMFLNDRCLEMRREIDSLNARRHD